MTTMINKDSILLLGGEGFVGRNLAKLFCKSMQCFSVSRTKSIFNNREDIFVKLNPYYEKLNRNFDIYIHLIDNKVDLDKKFLEEEKKLMKNLEILPSKHLIVFSSAVVYANPTSPYGRRKLTLEKFYTEYCLENSIHLTILRLFNAYGDYQMPFCQGSLIANLFYNHLNNKTSNINDINAQRDFIYSQDIAKITENIIKNKILGTYDIATGNLISIKELLKVIQNDIICNKLSVEYNDIKEVISCKEGNNYLYKQVSGISLVNGLERTYRFFVKYNEELSR
jgi:nucleoside-diphosphate-sugar epimerase